MSKDNTQRSMPTTEGTTPLTTRFDKAISALSGKMAFTGEQYIPGAGVEICYEHYSRYAFALQFIDSTTTVLDLGCGIGYGSVLLSERAKQVISLDRSETCIAALEDCVSTTGIDNIQCVCGDATQLAQISAIKDRRIDVVVCHEFIEHVPSETQAQLCKIIASAESPFHEKTLFLVSTPEKEIYAEHRTEPNEFHEHELTKNEFRSLLRQSFAHVQLYSQIGASANCIFPIETDSEAPSLTHAKFVNWLNPVGLVASLSDSSSAEGTFLYAIASPSEIPNRQTHSVLLDTNERLEIERMGQAARELQHLQAELTHYQALDRKRFEEIDLLKKDLKQGRNADSNNTAAYEQTISLQAAKIKKLLAAAEQAGSEREELLSLRDQLQKVAPDSQTALAELIEWRKLGQHRLGPTLLVARQQAEMLWGQAYAMTSFGHRTVTFLNRNVQKLWLGRKIQSLLKFLSAVRQA